MFIPPESVVHDLDVFSTNKVHLLSEHGDQDSNDNEHDRLKKHEVKLSCDSLIEERIYIPQTNIEHSAVRQNRGELGHARVDLASKVSYSSTLLCKTSDNWITA